MDGVRRVEYAQGNAVTADRWRVMRDVGWRGVALGMAATLVAALLFFGPTDNWIWDPSFYYGQLRSPVIDGNFDLSNEIIPIEQARGLASGAVPNPWPVGPAIAWSPFFLAAHGFVRLFGGFAADGFSPPYIAAVSAGSALYGLWGLLVLYRLCREFAPRGLSLLVTGLALGASPLFFYTFRQPIMAHSASFLAAAALVLVCVLAAQGRWQIARLGFLLGLLVGLNASLRFASILMALIPLTLYTPPLVSAAREQTWGRVARLAGQLLWFGLGVQVMLLPQVAQWWQVQHALLVYPAPNFGDTSPLLNTWNLFFYSNRGLLFWGPFILLGLIGLVRVQPIRLKVGLLLYIVAYLWLLVWREDLNRSGGFGVRYFIEALPVVAIGFVALLSEVWRHRMGRWVVTALALGLLLHHFSLMNVYEQSRFPYEAYRDGLPIGTGFQLENARYLARNPGNLLAARPYVGAARQTVWTTFAAGGADAARVGIPLAGVILLTLGVGVGSVLVRFASPRGVALSLSVYAVAWALFFLTIQHPPR